MRLKHRGLAAARGSSVTATGFFRINLNSQMESSVE